MSRKGQLWRGDLAQRIEGFLAGSESADELMDWALDHPFFEDQSELDDEDQRAIAMGLGRILELESHDLGSAGTSREQLADALALLWQR